MSLSRRDLLHRTKLDEFRDFCFRRGWEMLPLKGDYEVIRMKKGTTTHVFYERANDHARKAEIYTGSTHITVPEKAINLVRDFIRISKELK